jgi:hypothetical protein
MRIAFICTNCKKAHYNEKDVKPVNNELYVCNDVYDCKARFLNDRRNKNLSKFIVR